MSLLQLGVASLALLALLPTASACPREFQHDKLTTPTTALPTYTSDTTTIQATVGVPFLVELKSNPTTGYSWQVSEGYLLEDNAPGIAVSHCVYERKPATDSTTGQHMMGAGGVEKWIFTPTAEGEQLIPLQYARPWETEENAAAQPTIVYTVEVAPATAPSM